MKKNVFDFILKAPFVLRTFKTFFVLTFLVMWGNAMIRKLRLISKFMMSQTGKQTIIMLPNMSRNKGNLTMKFG